MALSTASYFYVTLKWNYKSAADAGTIVDFFHDASKGNGKARTFKWECPTKWGGHTYVVRFAQSLRREINIVSRHSLPDVRFKVVGKIAD